MADRLHHHPKTSRASIELSMIVRNGASTLGRCLASIMPFVDRIVIGDTGSTDDTIAIAKSFGAEVISVPWKDDFAAARNEVLSRATCDWVLVLDHDEMLDSTEVIPLIQEMLNDPQADAFGFWRRDYLINPYSEHPICKPVPNSDGFGPSLLYPAYTQSYHVRLFRRHPEVSFERCVHEQITDRFDRLGLSRMTAPFVIHHFGYVESDPSTLKEKIHYYKQLSLRRVQDDPGDFEGHFQLGICELMHFSEPEAALSHFRMSAVLRPGDGRAPLYAGLCLFRLGMASEAKHEFLRVLELGEQNQFLHECLGDTYLALDEYEESLAAYQTADAMRPYSALISAKRGVAEVHLGLIDEGFKRIHEAISRAPELSILVQLLRYSEACAVNT